MSYSCVMSGSSSSQWLSRDPLPGRYLATITWSSPANQRRGRGHVTTGRAPIGWCPRAPRPHIPSSYALRNDRLAPPRPGQGGSPGTRNSLDQLLSSVVSRSRVRILGPHFNTFTRYVASNQLHSLYYNIQNRAWGWNILFFQPFQYEHMHASDTTKYDVKYHYFV